MRFNAPENFDRPLKADRINKNIRFDLCNLLNIGEHPIVTEITDNGFIRLKDIQLMVRPKKPDPTTKRSKRAAFIRAKVI